jgi:UDP-glucose 4-epimerase
MNRNNILLLGGEGFIGTALTHHLSISDYQVHVVSRNLSEGKDGPGNVIRHRGDLADTGIISKLLPSCGTIVHLASCTTPGISALTPSMESELNILPTLQFLEILSDFKNRHLIFVSSGGTLYGNPEKVPTDEDMDLQPLSYHGAGKLAIETFLKTFSHLSGHSITIVRPSNIYGPGQYLQSGFGVIRTMLEHLIHESEMVIWGDGKAVRDFLYIDDMTRAIGLLVGGKRDHTVYNIGTGIGYSLNAVKVIIESVCGRRLKTRYMPKRQMDVKDIFLDAARFAHDTGWKPTVSLEKGIRKTWAWLRG